MSINVICASGNIGKDAEQRWTPNQKCIASFSLPVRQGYGEREKTSWVKCMLFGAKAEKLPQYLTKGTKVTVTGEFVMEEWTDQNGGKRSQPVIIVMDIDFGSSGNKQSAQQQPEPDFDSTIPF
ncbi:TPA: single-stranded DNA-binding protein [Enterobacter cloacae]|uniref:single-stranded DNA-binding protein n=1 Tax=Enterobacter cloacae TaxID=550 RepID=UPI00388D0A04|nr:single-stranded DNA-binding protein [Enterobacter cloacae]